MQHGEPLDALLVINYLNSSLPKNLPDVVLTGQEFPFFLDVFPDNLIAPRDALLAINRLNGVVGSGEGEAAALQAPNEGHVFDGSAANVIGGIDDPRASGTPSLPDRPGDRETPAVSRRTILASWDAAVLATAREDTVGVIGARVRVPFSETIDRVFMDWNDVVSGRIG